MPELPEVETVARTLSPVLAGKTFHGFELLWSRTLAYPDLERFSSQITGRSVKAVGRRAKLILIHLTSGSAISVHLRMTGELLYLSSSSVESHASSRHLRAGFSFTDDSRLLFYDVRKFGRIAYLDEGDLQRIDQAYGVEPLEAAFTAEWLCQQLIQRKRQIKTLLLDQSFIAGLGNIYVDESLFRAAIHPTARSDTLSRSQVELLHTAIIETLTGALERRGTTLRDYRSGLGEAGENRPRLLVYGSKPGSPCPRCGTALQRLVVGQRGSIYCPSCQPVSRT